MRQQWRPATLFHKIKCHFSLCHILFFFISDFRCAHARIHNFIYFIYSCFSLLSLFLYPPIAGESTIDDEKGRHSDEKSKIVIEIEKEERNGRRMLANRQPPFGYERFDETIGSIESILRWLFNFNGYVFCSLFFLAAAYKNSTDDLLCLA